MITQNSKYDREEYELNEQNSDQEQLTRTDSSIWYT